MESKTDTFKINVFKDKIFLQKDKIDTKLFNNPRFNSAVEDACSSLVSAIDGSFDFDFSNDKKDIVIISEGKLKRANGDYGENVALKTVTISLVGDSMVVDEAFGWLDDRDSLNKMKIDLDQEDSCALSTYYKHSIFDSNGLEMSKSFFGEFLFLLKDEECTIDVLKQRLLTSMHQPVFFAERLPGLPAFCKNAVSNCIHRDYENLAIAHVKKATNINRNSFFEVENSICEVFNAWPQDLIVSLENPVAVWDKNTYKYVTKNKYSTQTLDAATNGLLESFVENLENSKIKECYPEMYRALKVYTGSSKTL